MLSSAGVASVVSPFSSSSICWSSVGSLGFIVICGNGQTGFENKSDAQVVEVAHNVVDRFWEHLHRRLLYNVFAEFERFYIRSLSHTYKLWQRPFRDSVSVPLLVHGRDSARSSVLRRLLYAMVYCQGYHELPVLRSDVSPFRLCRSI